ncbi:hypothetical protein [Achromobacter sp. SLBN-14]|uniref:hypothetical protein n=1 Tax=Achromobacter sp. SLBN-14 TaxID=2768442 RepID=UPI001150604D|nr:hypothetical protein [Achromobacter sp. SLBN-14]TQJ97289.1 hypothetical protein FBY20_4084 [Achromobacter sp. SLBN-14]
MESTRSTSCGEALIGLGFIAMCIAFALHYPTNSDHWAAWIQAFGSVAAIAAAIWVFRSEAELQRKRDTEHARVEQIVMLESLATEIEAVWANFDAAVGAALERETKGPRDWTFAYSDSLFPVYQAQVPRIGVIENDDLRQRILHLYSSAKAYLLKMKLHNELSTKEEELTFRRATASRSSVPSDAGQAISSEFDEISKKLDRTREKLNANGQQIVDGVGLLRIEVDAALAHIRTAKSKLKEAGNLSEADC